MNVRNFKYMKKGIVSLFKKGTNNYKIEDFYINFIDIIISLHARIGK